MNFTNTDPIVIRQARDADTGKLDRLAVLDSAKLSSGPFLIAEVAGEPRAAISMADGRAVADPFFPSAQLVELMRVRLMPSTPGRDRGRLLAGLRTAAAPGR